jgi:hypothetical protein
VPGSPYDNPSPYAGPSPYESYPSHPQPPYGQQPPYGAGGGPYPGAAPYGYPAPPGTPQGWYARDRTTNGFAIASLVTSLTTFVPFLGIVLGIVGLRQISRRGQQGKGLAIAGLIINAVTTVVIAVVITVAVLDVFHGGNTRVDDIAVGECFDTVGTSLSDYDGEGADSDTVDVLPCEEEHDAEAYAIFTLDSDLGENYPGEERISDVADSKCASSAHDYLDGNPIPKTVEIYYYLPPRDGWNRGDHSVTCFFGATGGKVTGSVRAADHSSAIGV